MALLLCGSAQVQAAAPHWVGSWMASPCPADTAEPRYSEAALQAETVRQIVHLSIGGLGVRLRFSNLFGSTPLTLTSVQAAQRLNGPQIDAETQKAVTFGGKAEVTIPPGGSVVSDMVAVATKADTDLAVSYFVPAKIVAPAIHYTALQTSFVAKGDQAAAATLTGPRKITLDLILTGVDVATRTSPGAIVAIGSSTTDGAHSTPNANHRWTDVLAARLREAEGDDAESVLNAGISGNRVLHDGQGDWGPIFGQSAVTRFARDVLAQPGVRTVIVFEGGNDIREPALSSQRISAGQLIQGFQLLAHNAHEHKLKVLVATITAFEHSSAHPEPSWEEDRLAVNQWIRTSHEIDGFIDFAAATGDPQHSARLLPAYDSGDHLHPNDAGYKAMADSIDLKLLQ